MTKLFHSSSPYSWRAFFAFVAVMTGATGLLAHGNLSGDQWVSVTQWIGGFFISGEAARKFSGSATPPPAE